MLDHELGIVQLAYPVYKIGEDGHQVPAELTLRCAFQARAAGDTGLAPGLLYEQYAVSTLPVPHENASGVARVDDPDMWRCVIQEYADGDPTSVTDNLPELQGQGQALADAYAHHYRDLPQLSMQWNGIVPFHLDGNIHFLRWQLGGGQFLTWGGKNMHYRYMAPSLAEQRANHALERSHRL